MDENVKRVYDSYPLEYRQPLLQMRELIYNVANQIPEVGIIEESLKWGQPTYSTIQTKSGSPIRLDRFGEDEIAILFHCQTSLIESFKTLFHDSMKFSKNRAIVINPEEGWDTNQLELCIEMALTYHLNKNKK